MTHGPIKATRKQLDKTVTRLTNLSSLMTIAETQIHPGGRSERTKLFLELSLPVFISDYDKAIRELTEQQRNLRKLQAEVNQ